MSWFSLALKKYATFTGRSRRKEYWYFFLFILLISMAIGFVEGLAGIDGILTSILAIALMVPCLAVGVRRLQDIGKSGWWLLIGLVPLIGGLAILFFAVSDSKPGENQYGPNPKVATGQM